MTSFSESVSLPPSIVTLHRVSPIRLQLGSASVISVQVLGHPVPWVSWFIGKNRIQKTNPNFRAEVDGEGRRHDLRVTKVTRELDEGVAIEARNDAGSDYRRIAVAICQDGQVEDVTSRTSTTLASSNGAFERTSSFGGELPVAGRSNYSFTDDVFDELISPGIPPLLLVQQKETIFPDDASREILCPTDGSSREPATIKAQEKKNLRTKATDVKSGRHTNETAHNALEDPAGRSAAREVWKLDGVALDTFCRDLLRDAVPTEDDMDELVSQNENWKPRRSSNSRVAAKSEAEEFGHNERNISQPSAALGSMVTAPDANAKKTSKLGKLKDRIKKIKMLSSGKKQNKDDKDHSPSIGLHPTTANEALESQIMSKQDKTPKSDESSRGKTSGSKKIPRNETSTSAENGRTVEVIVPFSAEANNSVMFPTIGRVSTEKQASPRHEKSKGYTSKNGLVERQNDLAGSGDLSPAGYIGPKDTLKYKTLQGGKESDSNKNSNENAITDANRKESNIDLANKKLPQASSQSRQIESQTRGGFPRIQLIMKDQKAVESSGSNEIFDENKISLTCSSPPADEVERCRHRLSSSLSQEEKSSSKRFHQRRNDSDTRADSVANSSHGMTGYSSSDDLGTGSCGVASPTSPEEQCVGRMKQSDDRSSKTGPVETQSHGWVVEKRTRAQPTPRSRSYQRPSSAGRRSWIESARSVEIQVPRRSRSTSRTRRRGLNKEWDLVTVTTRTEEIRTLPNAPAAYTKAAVATANKSIVSEDEVKFKSTTTKTTTAAKTAKSTTKAKIEAQDTAVEPAKKSPKIRTKQISMESSHHTISSRPERDIYRTAQSSLERSNNSSVDSNSIDAGEYVLGSCPTAGQEEILNSSDSKMVELRFKVIDINPDTRMAEISHGVAEVGYDVNCEMNEVNQKTHLVDVNHEFNYNKETAERNLKLDEVSRKRHLVQVNHEVNRNNARIQPNNTRPSEVSHEIDNNIDSVEPSLELPQVSHEKKTVEFSNVEVTELNAAVNKLSAEMTELNTDKAQLSSTEEPSGILRRHYSLGLENDGFRGGSQTRSVSLDSEVLERNAQEVRLSSERTELKDEAAQLNRAMTRLSAEMVELNSDIPERIVNVPSSNFETCEVKIALPKRSNSMFVQGRNETPVGRTSCSVIVATEHSFLTPHEKTLQESYTSLHISGNREQPNIASEFRKDRQREEGKTKNASRERISHSERHESTHADETESTDSSVFERVEDDIHTGKFETSMDSDDVFAVESVTSKVTPEVTHSVKNTDDADITDSLTQEVMPDVTRAQHSEDAVTTIESMTTEVMSGVSEDNDDADTMESLTPDVMSEVNAAVTDATARNIRTEAGSFEETDEDSYAIVDDNWKNSYDTRYAAIDVHRTEEADTCEEDETSMAIENILEYKQVEADTLEGMRGKELDLDNGQNNKESFSDDVPSSTVIDTRVVSQDTVVFKIPRDAGTSTVENDLKRNSLWLADTTAKDSGTDRHSEFPEADDDQITDYVTYIRSVFGARSLSSSVDERDSDARNNKEVGTSSDPTNLFDPTVHRHTANRPIAKLARNTAIDTQDLTNNGMITTVSEQTDKTVDELKPLAKPYAGPTKALTTLGFDSNSPSFKDSEDAPLCRAERKISVSSLVLRRPDVRHVTVEERTIGSTATYPKEEAVHSVTVETDCKAHRSELHTEIKTARPQFSRSITLPGPIISQGQSDRKAGSTNRVVSLVEIVINSLGIEKSKVYDVPLSRTSGRPARTSELNLQIEKNYVLEGLHLARPYRTCFSWIKFQTEKTFVLKGPHLARLNPTSLSENNFVLEGPHLARPNATSMSEIKFQTEKNFVLKGPHLARPNPTSLSEIKFQTEKNFVLEGPHLERPNPTSLSEIKFQTENNFVLEGPHLAKSNRTSLSGIKLQTEKNYVIEGLHLARPNPTLLSEINFQVEKNFVLEGPHLARPNRTSLSGIKLKREKNYVIEGLHLARPNPTLLSEIKIQREKNYALEGPHLAKLNPTSLSELKFQTEKNFALEGPHRVSQTTAAKPTASRTFRTILTIIGQGSNDDTSSDKEQETGIGTNKNPVSEGLNNSPNEVTSLTIPTCITIPLSETDEMDLIGSPTATRETDANVSEQKLSNSYSSEVRVTPRSEEDNKVVVSSESIEWNSSSGDKRDNTNDNIYFEILSGSSSETRKVRIEDKDAQDDETVADREEGYDATNLGLNQVNPYTGQPAKALEDSDRFEEDLALAAITAEDLEIEEDEFQQDIEFAEMYSEYESKEMISEVIQQDEIQFDQATLVTRVESESEPESEGDANSFREGSVDMLEEKLEERESYVNDNDEFHEKKSEENHEIIDELTAEVGSHFDQTMLVTSVETEGDLESGNADKISWKEEETIDMLAEEEAETQYEKEIEEHHDIRDELIFEDESRFDQWTIVTSVKKEVELESGETDKSAWKEEETLYVLKDEETEKSRLVNVAEALNDNDIIDELITDDGNHLDQAMVDASVETEREIEIGNSGKTGWTEEEALDMLNEEEKERNRYIEITKAGDDNETSVRHEIIGEFISEDVGRASRKDEPESGDMETSGNAENISWEEEEDMVTDEEDRDKYNNVTEGQNDNKLIEELIVEDEGHFDRTVIVTCVETDGEAKSGNTDKTSWKEEDTIDMLVDEEGEENYEEVIEEHHELISEDESRFDQWTVVTIIETEDESKNGNVDKISWKEEETAEVLMDEEEKKEEEKEEEEEIKRYVDITKKHHGKEIEEHNEELISEDESRFDQWTVVTKVVAESESERGNAEETVWKEEVAAEETVWKEEVAAEENAWKEEVAAEESAWKDEVAADETVWNEEIDTEETVWNEEIAAEETGWKEEVAADLLQDEEIEKSRHFNAADAHCDKEITDEWITEDGAHIGHTMIMTSVETDDESENGEAGKTSWREEQSEYILRDEEETNRYLNLTEEHYDEEIEEHDETIGEVMLEDESHFDQVVVFTKVETEGESESERADMTSWTEEETTDTQKDKGTSGQHFLNPESLGADFNDHSEHIEVTQNGRAQEDTEIKDETTYNLESGDNEGSQIEYGSETEHLQTLARPKEKSYSEQSAGEYQTTRGTESIADYESRSEELSEKIWQMLESQNIERKDPSSTDSRRDNYLESQSDDYLESMSQSLSEKRWQEMELRLKASCKNLADAQGSVNNAENGFDYETWKRDFDERKNQIINSAEKRRYPEVNDKTTGRSFGERKFQTITEVATTNPAEKEKCPEIADEDEIESFSTGMHEEGWRTITVNEQSSANANSDIKPGQSGSADGRESQNDDYMVTYEYGEMYSVFHHIPFSIQTLRESVMDNFNSSPTMKRLLTRYPSLRPGTWKWSSTSRESPRRRPWDNTAPQNTRIKEVQHLDAVSAVDQFTPQLMTEKFDTV